MGDEKFTLVNLTPHPINLYGSNTLAEGPVTSIPTSGQVARVETIDCGWWPIDVGDTIRLSYQQYGKLSDIPPPKDFTGYIVSLVAALAARERDDLLAPYEEVRNDHGTVVGCRFLQKVC